MDTPTTHALPLLSLAECYEMNWLERHRTRAIERLSPEDRAQYEKDRADELDAAKARRLAEANLERMADIKRTLKKVPPALLNEFDLDQHPSPASHQKVMAWKPSSKGLRLTGLTGKGKSRSMAQLCRQFVENFTTVEACKSEYFEVKHRSNFEWQSWIELAPEFHRLHLLGYKDNAQDAFDSLVKRHQKIDLLFLDELGGKNANHPIACDALHRIIDYRYTHGLPIIYSANCDLQELQAKLLDEHGKTVRRLHDMTTHVDFDSA